MLEENQVLRNVDRGTQFGRLQLEDATPICLSYTVSWFGCWLTGINDIYAFVPAAVMALLVWFLKRRFEDGVWGVLQYLNHPKSYSAFAPDLLSRPYPGAPRSGDPREP